MDRTRRGSTSWWSWNTPTYSLSPARTASTARVASARATGRTPVTRGSRTPAWPAFGTANMTRTEALAWWDVVPAVVARSAHRTATRGVLRVSYDCDHHTDW